MASDLGFLERFCRARDGSGGEGLRDGFRFHVAFDEAYDNRSHVEAFPRHLGPEAVHQVPVCAESGLLQDPYCLHVRLLPLCIYKRQENILGLFAPILKCWQLQCEHVNLLTKVETIASQGCTENNSAARRDGNKDGRW